MFHRFFLQLISATPVEVVVRYFQTSSNKIPNFLLEDLFWNYMFFGHIGALPSGPNNLYWLYTPVIKILNFLRSRPIMKLKMFCLNVHSGTRFKADKPLKYIYNDHIWPKELACICFFYTHFIYAHTHTHFTNILPNWDFNRKTL